MVERADWTGVLAGRRSDAAETALIAPLRQSNAGGSGAFLGLGSDRFQYWIKPLNNGQGQRVPATEQIVARVGALIGAPTCEVRTISIPEAVRGWEFRPGLQLLPGVAHASRHVGNVVETRDFDHRLDDDNRRRHLWLAALHDWCWGSDTQGLWEMDRDFTFHSHDHGWYLPPSGPDWNEMALLAHVDVPNELIMPDTGINPQMAAECATRLEAVTRQGIAEALAAIPSCWPVADVELEATGFFLERRASAVAGRVRQRFGV